MSYKSHKTRMRGHNWDLDCWIQEGRLTRVRQWSHGVYRGGQVNHTAFDFRFGRDDAIHCHVEADIPIANNTPATLLLARPSDSYGNYYPLGLYTPSSNTIWDLPHPELPPCKGMTRGQHLKYTAGLIGLSAFSAGVLLIPYVIWWVFSNSAQKSNNYAERVVALTNSMLQRLG